MDRRNFMKHVIILGGIVVMPEINMAASAMKKEEKPNILFIMTDQQTASAMGNRDNSWVKTPNMDRLAQHGTSFTKAYCAQPLCGPSRSAMLTGKYPHQLNATINLPEKEGYWSRETKIVGTIMKDAGYDTGYVGKWHLPVPVSNKQFHGFDFMRNTKRRDWQDASIPADCSDFLKIKRDKPFFLVASFINPHDICEWARGQKLRMDEIPLSPPVSECPPLPDNLDIPAGEPEFLRNMLVKSPKQYPTIGWENKRWRQYSWAYYRLVEKVDFYIGLVLEALERSGHLENTIIVFTSDHGDSNGAHRLNQKQVLYEEAANVPFIISHLTKGTEKLNKQTLINTGLDLIPTFCDYAGIEQPANLDGISARKYVEDLSGSGRDYLFIETEFADGGESFEIVGRAVRNERYKYMIYSEGEKREQLFDLEKDPGEMVDLVNNPTYQSIRKEFQEELIKWQKKTGDHIKLFN